MPGGTAVRIELFGRVRVSYDGAVIPIPPRTAPFLAYIALARGSVARSKIAVALWPDASPADAAANVRRHMHALQRACAAGIDEDIVVADRTLISLAPGTVTDVAEFERLASADATLADAIERYRDDLLADLSDPWIGPERERLRARYVRTLQQLCEARRAAGDAVEAKRYVEMAIARDPWDEELVRTAMTLCWERGNRVGALRSYRALEKRLRDDLQSEPAPDLRALAASIESGAAYVHPGYLPGERDLSTFVGRATDLESIAGVLEERHHAVIIGPPGVGKTRTALRLARRRAMRYPDGVWFVDCSPLAPKSAVEPAIAAVLSGQGGSSRNALADMLAAKRLLLIVDNCEHVAGEARAAIARILTMSPYIDVLATSRSVLGAGLATWPLAPLAVPGEGVTLFVERARTASGTNAPLDPENPVVIDVCRRLDGLPLAIELAAARLRSTPLADVVRELNENRNVLDDDGDDLTPGLRAAFDWSYALLEESEQRFLRAVATFRRGWTAEAAAAVAETDERSARALVRRLVDRSLVIAPAGDASPASYQMLQSLREYALGMGDGGARDALRVRHARYIAERVSGDAPLDLFAAERRTDHTAIADVFDDVRAALETLLVDGRGPALGIDLVIAVGLYWVDSVPWDESRRWLRAALASPAAVRRQQAALHTLLSRLALRQGETAESFREGDEAVALTASDSDEAARACALLARARAAWMRADLDAARRDANDAYERCSRANLAYGRARSLSALYLTFISAGDVARARECANGAAALYGELDAQVELAEAHANLGTCAYYAADMSEAESEYRRAFHLVSSTSNERLTAFVVHNLASTEWQNARTSAAWTHIADAIGTAMRIGYPAIVIRSIELVARWCVADDPYAAAEFAAAAEAGAKEFGAPFQAVELDDHQQLLAAIAAAPDASRTLLAATSGAKLSLDVAAGRAVRFALTSRQLMPL